MDKYQALNELLQDEAKAAEIFTESMEETQANLKKEGLDFSLEELEDLAVKASVTAGEGELDADDLDNVSGGARLISTGCYFIPRIIVGVVSRWIKRRG